MDSGRDIETDVNSPGRSAALQSLLERLGVGKEGASAYEQLRLRLVTFFRLRFPVEAEALADEAIDRLGRRIEEGTPIDNPASYALGIARYLVLEAGARQRKETEAAREALFEHELHSPELHSPETESDPALPALRACLEAMDGDSARLILEYYGADDGGSRIERRQHLAESFGLSLNALRNRALRTRLALEKCVSARLVGKTVNSSGDVPSKTYTRGRVTYSPDEASSKDAYE